MARTIHASSLQEALSLARGVGKLEDPLTIAGCEVVLQNLSPEDYENIAEELAEVPEEEYLFAYQISHVTRSIVELNGYDLRDVDFVEVEIPSGTWIVQLEVPTEKSAEHVIKYLKDAKLEARILPPEDGETRTVAIERSAWLRDHVLSTWRKEALSVAWRKFAELLIRADENAKQGVIFSVPDETTEDRYRRLINDLQEAAEDMPNELVDVILGEHDLLRKSSRVELEQATARMASIQPVEAETPPAPEPPPAPAASPAPVAQPPKGSTSADAQEAMASRQPLNQQAVQVPVPVSPTEPTVQPVRTAAAVPAHIREAAQANSASLGLSEPVHLGRAEQIAQLESLDGLNTAAPPSQGLDPKTLLDPAPAAGVNAKYNPPPRR